MTFTLTPAHLALLNAAYVRWDDCEYGAPAIDSKRPYGNSGSLVERDIARILGWIYRDEEPTEAQREHALQLHAETETALQIVLSTQSFKCGVYQSEARMGGPTRWRLIA